LHFLFPCYLLYFVIALFALILLWTPKLKKWAQLLARNANCFWQLSHFFSSLNILPVTFIFSFSRYLLINTWSLRLIRPITTSLCVPSTTAWKYLTSSLWMNVTNFIFQLLHIRNLLTLFILIPLCSPCTPFADCAHLFDDYENISSDYANFSTNYAHNFDGYAKTIVDSIDMPESSKYVNWTS
jgi:hypothetical protein